MQIAKLSSNPSDEIFQKLKLILNSGADVNIVNCDGFTGISPYKDTILTSVAAHYAFNVEFDNTAVHLLLFHKKANLNITDSAGNNYLHYVVDKQLHFPTLKMLLANRINTNQQNYAGFTPLHSAIQNKLYVTACTIAVSPQTVVNIQNKGGQTALHMAIVNWTTTRNSGYSKYPFQVNDLAIILIQKRADLTIKGIGKTICFLY